MPDLGAFLNTLLSYMDKPWKIFAIIALVGFGVIAFTAYERRVQIATALLNRYGDAHLELGKFKDKAPILLRTTNADGAILLRLNLDSNWVQPLVGYARDGSEWLPDPTPRPIIHLDTSARVIIEVINGQSVCSDVAPNNPLMHQEYEVGVRYVCFIGVPPFTGAMVGLLTLAWDTQPSPSVEYIAKQSLRSMAMDIASW